MVLSPADLVRPAPAREVGLLVPALIVLRPPRAAAIAAVRDAARVRHARPPPSTPAPCHEPVDGSSPSGDPARRPSHAVEPCRRSASPSPTSRRPVGPATTGAAAAVPTRAAAPSPDEPGRLDLARRPRPRASAATQHRVGHPARNGPAAPDLRARRSTDGRRSRLRRGCAGRRSASSSCRSPTTPTTCSCPPRPTGPGSTSSCTTAPAPRGATTRSTASTASGSAGRAAATTS